MLYFYRDAFKSGVMYIEDGKEEKEVILIDDNGSPVMKENEKGVKVAEMTTKLVPRIVVLTPKHKSSDEAFEVREVLKLDENGDRIIGEDGKLETEQKKVRVSADKKVPLEFKDEEYVLAKYPHFFKRA